MTAVPAHGGLWADAALGAALLAVDPVGLGGAVLRARVGPAREAWLAELDRLLPAALPRRRLPPEIADDRLLGGLDLAETLKAGRPAWRRGVLSEADGGVVLLPMAERTPRGLAGRLAAALDRGEVLSARDARTGADPSRFALVLLDEGAEPDEAAPATLAERLAFRFDLSPLGAADLTPPPWGAHDIALARERLGRVACADDALGALAQTAALLGIASLRAPLLALRTARAVAALAGEAEVSAESLGAATRLVLAHRATQIPADPDAPPNPPEPDQAEEPPEPEAQGGEDARDRPLEDIVLDAAKAALPDDILAGLMPATAQKGAAGGQMGGERKAARRGRPAGTRPARPGADERLDLVATLRSAAPWQPVRRRHRAGRPDGPEKPGRQGLIVERGDIRAKRFIEPAESLLIFVVDASGSAAAGRLAEAKGAVERLLARTYERREDVSLIAFRNTNAELLLPPTRSLTRAKKALQGLPGGGPTPLAAGLKAALLLAEQTLRRGATPYLVVLTDGRGNIRLDGTPGRSEAREEAHGLARRIRARGLGALLIDMGARAQAEAADLGAEMGARYLALPRADAGQLERAVRAGRAA